MSTGVVYAVVLAAVFGGLLLTLERLSRSDCYVSPMGGVPVDPVEIHGRPYVCGWSAAGYVCRTMEACQ